MQSLLSPLKADLFMSISPQTKRNLKWRRRHWILVLNRMLPVSILLADDADIEQQVIGMYNHTNATRKNEIEDCTMLQRLPRKVYNLTVGHPTLNYRITHNQLGVCSPQRSLALRFQGCLGMIESAELKKRSMYEWVVRTRPDYVYPCKVDHRIFAKDGVVFEDDFFASMPRSAATVSLQQIPIAHRMQASLCFYEMTLKMSSDLTQFDDSGDRDYWHTMEPLWNFATRASRILAALGSMARV